MENVSEQELIEMLKENKSKRKAFEILVDQYSQQLYWQIRRMVLSHDDANDILQNTFLKAWQSIDSFRAESKLSTWLYRICMNETISFMNKQKENVPIDDEDNGICNNLESDPYFDGDETQLQLQQAIALLPDRQREVFTLKYFQEMKYEEISDILGTSIGALKTSYHLAVEKIVAFFQNRD